MTILDTAFNKIGNSPVLIGITSGAFALIYFFVSSISHHLPPAIIFGLFIGMLVYKLTNKEGGVETFANKYKLRIK